MPGILICKTLNEVFYWELGKNKDDLSMALPSMELSHSKRIFFFFSKCRLGEEISSFGCDCCSGTDKVTENSGTHAPEHYKSRKAPRWGRDLLTAMTRWAGSDRTARPWVFSPTLFCSLCALLL